MNTSHEKHPPKNKVLAALKKLGLFLMGALLIVNTIQLARFGGLVENVDTYNKGVVKEIGGIRSDVVTFANDLNEMRKFLLLPTKDYSVLQGENENTNDDDQNNNQTATAVYSFLGKLEDEELAAQNEQKAVDTAKNILDSQDLKDGLSASQLSTGKLEENEKAATFKILSSNTPLFAVLVDKKTADVSVQSVLGSQSINPSDSLGLSSGIISYIKSNKTKAEELKKTIDQVKADLLVTIKQPTWASLLSSRKITFLETPDENDTSIDYSFTNADQEKLLTLKILRTNGQIELNDKTYSDVKSLASDLQSQLQTVDTSSAQEKMTKARQQELEAVFKEQAFQDLLKKDELTIATQPREEYNKILYDVKDKNGKVAFSFAIEISSGAYKVLKDNTEIDLFGAMQDEGSKKKP